MTAGGAERATRRSPTARRSFGGRPPYEEIFRPAVDSGRFRLVSATGSLRLLTRVD